jgi:hypothetical protein
VYFGFATLCFSEIYRENQRFEQKNIPAMMSGFYRCMAQPTCVGQRGRLSAISDIPKRTILSVNANLNGVDGRK